MKKKEIVEKIIKEIFFPEKTIEIFVKKEIQKRQKKVYVLKIIDDYNRKKLNEDNFYLDTFPEEEIENLCAVIAETIEKALNSKSNYINTINLYYENENSIKLIPKLSPDKNEYATLQKKLFLILSKEIWFEIFLETQASETVKNAFSNYMLKTQVKGEYITFLDFLKEELDSKEKDPLEDLLATLDAEVFYNEVSEFYMRRFKSLIMEIISNEKID